MIVHHCRSCGKTYQIDGSLVGRRVRCKECGEVSRVEADYSPLPSRPVATPTARPIPAPTDWPAPGDEPEVAAPVRRTAPRPSRAGRTRFDRSQEESGAGHALAMMIVVISIIFLATRALGYYRDPAEEGSLIDGLRLVGMVWFFLGLAWVFVRPARVAACLIVSGIALATLGETMLLMQRRRPDQGRPPLPPPMFVANPPAGPVALNLPRRPLIRNLGERADDRPPVRIEEIPLDPLDKKFDDPVRDLSARKIGEDPPEPTALPSAETAGEPYSRNRLVAVPPLSTFGGETYTDIGPTGSKLVGLRVGIAAEFGGRKLGAVQPIYRKGVVLLVGERFGTQGVALEEVMARPGYAVAGFRTHTGLLVDGFEIVFMKEVGDRLDPRDAYLSPWIGDPEGGGPRDALGGGRPVVGIHGVQTDRHIGSIGIVRLR